MSIEKENEIINNTNNYNPVDDMTDLDILYPEDATIKFKDRSGKVHQYSIFIPASVGMYLTENITEIMELVEKRKPTPNNVKMIKRIITLIFQAQNPEINEQWIDANLSLPRQLIILIKCVMPILNYIKSMGPAMGELMGTQNPLQNQ